MNPPAPLSLRRLEAIRRGQRLILIAILLNIGSLPFQLLAHDVSLLVISLILALGSLIFAITGILRMTFGLYYSTAARVLFCIGVIIPLVNLILLLVLNGKATSTLRQNGYTVSLFGASWR